jgi:tyrosyl-tRNA synthetase
VGISEPPEEIYGRTLRIPDAALPEWYDLLLGRTPPTDLGPRDAKRALARALVERFHGPEASAAAEADFDRRFVARELPDEIPDAWLDPAADPVHLPELLSRLFGGSRSEARRKLAQGGVRLDGVALDGDALDLPATELAGKVLQLGKRQYRRLRLGSEPG